MCGLDEGGADQVQGKNKKPLKKKLRKSFGDSENSRIFAPLVRHIKNTKQKGKLSSLVKSLFIRFLMNVRKFNMRKFIS